MAAAVEQDSNANIDSTTGDGLKSDEKDLMADSLPIWSDTARQEAIDESKKAFYNRRRLQIPSIPMGVTAAEVRKTLLKTFAVEDVFIDNQKTAHILFSNPNEAKKALSFIRGKKFKERILGASYSQNEFMLFVGNLPYDCTLQQFRDMVEQHGPIERIFLVYGKETKQLKGYGFVEYRKKVGVNTAKRELPKAHEDLAIEHSNSGLYEYNDLQSQTLCVKKFPASTTSEQIEEVINKHVQVPFCKIQTDPVTGEPQDFALVDCKCPEDAEMLWKKLDGFDINGGKMKITFSSPGRLASITVGADPSKTSNSQNETIVIEAKEDVKHSSKPDKSVDTPKSSQFTTAKSPGMPSNTSRQPHGNPVSPHGNPPIQAQFSIRGPRGPANPRMPGPDGIGPKPLMRGPRLPHPGPRQGPPGINQRPQGQREESPRGPRLGPPGPGQRPPALRQGLPGPRQGPFGPRQGPPGPRQEPPGPRQGTPGPRQGPPGPRQGPPGSRQGPLGPRQALPGPRQEHFGPRHGPPEPRQGHPGQRQRHPGPGQGPPGHKQGPADDRQGFPEPRQGPPGSRQGLSRPRPDLRPRQESPGSRKRPGMSQEFNQGPSRPAKDDPGSRQGLQGPREGFERHRQEPTGRGGDLSETRHGPGQGAPETRQRPPFKAQGPGMHFERPIAPLMNDKQMRDKGYDGSVNERRRWQSDDNSSYNDHHNVEQSFGYGDRDGEKHKGGRHHFDDQRREFTDRYRGFPDQERERRSDRREFGDSEYTEKQGYFPETDRDFRGYERDYPANQGDTYGEFRDQSRSLQDQRRREPPYGEDSFERIRGSTESEGFRRDKAAMGHGDFGRDKQVPKMAVYPGDSSRRFDPEARRDSPQDRQEAWMPDSASRANDGRPDYTRNVQDQRPPPNQPPMSQSFGGRQDIPGHRPPTSSRDAYYDNRPIENQRFDNFDRSALNPDPARLNYQAPPESQDRGPFDASQQLQKTLPGGNIAPGLLQDPPPGSQISKLPPLPLGMLPPRFPSQSPSQPPSQPAVGNMHQSPSTLQRPPWQQQPTIPKQQQQQQISSSQQQSIEQPGLQQSLLPRPQLQQPPMQPQPSGQQPFLQQPPPMQPQSQHPLQGSSLSPMIPPQHLPRMPSVGAANRSLPPQQQSSSARKQPGIMARFSLVNPATTTTTLSNTLPASLPAMPRMPGLNMPNAPVGPLLPPVSGMQQPLNSATAAANNSMPAGGAPPITATTAQTKGQLDTYVTAASVAQQYAQYYEQLAKHQQNVSQQPSAAGNKEAVNMASQANAYAQYYQQYYQHMQQVIQMTKMSPGASTAGQQVPPNPIASQQPAPSIAGQSAQTSQQNKSLPAHLQMQQQQPQQQRPALSQWPQQMAPGRLQQPPSQALPGQSALSNQPGRMASQKNMQQINPGLIPSHLQQKQQQQPNQAWMPRGSLPGQQTSQNSVHHVPPQRPGMDAPTQGQPPRPLMSDAKQPTIGPVRPSSAFGPGQSGTPRPQHRGNGQRMPFHSSQAPIQRDDKRRNHGATKRTRF
eukprot:gene7939-8794_t